jgi:hypothetical protein
MSLVDIGQEITIYLGFLVVIIGVIGNGMNIFVFSTFRPYRRTPCTFYFLVGSIHNIAFLAIDLISRIVSAGFGFDITRTSISWCKIREFSLFTLGLISLTCSCLATIDQFFATSQNTILRRFSNIKWAHRIALIVIIICCLHGTLPLVFFNISPGNNMCVNVNTGFGIYIRVYLLTLVSGIPVLVMLLFGYLTYRNIHFTRFLSVKADRQLTRMILIQVVLVTICITPYGIYSAYDLATEGVNKDGDRSMKESFALTILGLVPYFYYAVCLFRVFIR